MLRLSEVVGADVRSGDGERLGRLVDLTVEVGDAHPAVRRLAVGRLAVGRRPRIDAYVDWAAVAAFEHDGIQVTGPGDPSLAPKELRLARDVLDTQIVDVDGKRTARVSEVLLARRGPLVHVVAVDVGAAGVWRRLGLGRVSARMSEKPVDWADLHLISWRGHALQLATPEARIHSLEPAELAALVAHLPTADRTTPRDASPRQPPRPHHPRLNTISRRAQPNPARPNRARPNPARAAERGLTRRENPIRRTDAATNNRCSPVLRRRRLPLAVAVVPATGRAAVGVDGEPTLGPRLDVVDLTLSAATSQKSGSTRARCL